MAKVGVQRATELTGKSKSTIQRAMKAGKVSYEVDGNRKLIDVSELERVYGISQNQNDNANANTAPSYDAELQKAKHTLEIDRLEMKVKMLEGQLDAANDQIEELKAQRDGWQKQAQQVLLTTEHSQKQYDSRIAEFERREQERKRAIEAKRQEMERRKAIAASNQNTKSNNANSLIKALFTKQKKSA
jgi:chromosome segregation ATPase